MAYFLLNEQNVSVIHVHWHLNAISCLDLNNFLQDGCFCSKLWLEVDYAKSNLKTSHSQNLVICHLLPFVRVGRHTSPSPSFLTQKNRKSIQNEIYNMIELRIEVLVNWINSRWKLEGCFGPGWWCKSPSLFEYASSISSRWTAGGNLKCGITFVVDSSDVLSLWSGGPSHQWSLEARPCCVDTCCYCGENQLYQFPKLLGLRRSSFWY